MLGHQAAKEKTRNKNPTRKAAAVAETPSPAPSKTPSTGRSKGGWRQKQALDRKKAQKTSACDKVTDTVEKLKTFVAEDIYSVWADECGTLSDESISVHTDARSTITKLQAAQMVMEAWSAESSDMCDTSHLATCVGQLKINGVAMPSSTMKKTLKKARE